MGLTLWRLLWWSALIVFWYALCLFVLYVSDVGEDRHYGGRAGLRLLLLHGLLFLPIAALVAIYVPWCPIC
jgi:hypothetical protein